MHARLAARGIDLEASHTAFLADVRERGPEAFSRGNRRHLLALDRALSHRIPLAIVLTPAESDVLALHREVRRARPG